MTKQIYIEDYIPHINKLYEENRIAELVQYLNSDEVPFPFVTKNYAVFKLVPFDDRLYRANSGVWKLSEIPNSETLKAMQDADTNKDMTSCTDAEDMFKKLDI